MAWLLQYIAKKELYIEGYFRQKVFSFNQFAIMIALIIKQKVAFPNLTEWPTPLRTAFCKNVLLYHKVIEITLMKDMAWNIIIGIKSITYAKMAPDLQIKTKHDDGYGEW